MKKIVLKIKNAEYEDYCLIPLSSVPALEKGIKKINYDKKIQLAEIIYDERLLNQMQIIKKLKEADHEVIK